MIALRRAQLLMSLLGTSCEQVCDWQLMCEMHRETVSKLDNADSLGSQLRVETSVAQNEMPKRSPEANPDTRTLIPKSISDLRQMGSSYTRGLAAFWPANSSQISKSISEASWMAFSLTRIASCCPMNFAKSWVQGDVASKAYLESQWPNIVGYFLIISGLLYFGV